jgi:DNA-directed RNA polymerase specialized sigma24 family protein
MAKDFEKWETAVAKNVVNGFLKNNKLRRYDFGDLVNECLVHWYQKRGKYKANKGATKKTFMGRILGRRLQEILREQLADKRKVNQVAERMVAISDEADSDGDTYDLSEKKQEEEFRLSEDNLGLKSDLGSVMAKLSPLQRQICYLRMDDYPMAHISRILNKPRTTLYGEIERIQRIFFDEGLKEYLE